MRKRVIDLGTERPCLDIASFGQRGPEARLTPSEVASIARTARRVPEVMVKVSGGARTLQGVGAHFDYIGREGLNEIETDMGETLIEREFEQDLLLDWDLDLGVRRRHTDRAIAHGRKPPKLVHNLIFSMPKGTPADKLEAAVRAFAVDRFALRHRYAMALHTHQGNPHVHLVVKAVSEQGVRLNIRKATLRDWRQQFVTDLREQGIAANATERAVRGESRVPKTDGVFRSAERDSSTYVQAKLNSYVRRDRNQPEPGKAQLVATRREVEQGWYVVHDLLEREGHSEVARDIRRFLAQMHPRLTESEQIAVDADRKRKEKVRTHEPRTR
jgi:MobA/VirD2-like, nuclease domain